MKHRKPTVHGAVGSIRRHPVRAAAICVPLLAVSVFTGGAMASATPAPTLAVSRAALNAAPGQHVLNVDNKMTGPVITHADGSTVPRETVNIDGCDHDYGKANVCVPWRIPGSTTAAKCHWLKSNGYRAVQVHGTNRQDLPENADGYICP